MIDKITFECAELKYEEESSEEEITSTEESTDSQETDIVIPEPQVVEKKYTADMPISFEGFGEMEYALFLETNVGYGLNGFWKDSMKILSGVSKLSSMTLKASKMIM